MLFRVFPVTRSEDGAFLEYGQSDCCEEAQLEICFHTKEAWNLFEVRSSFADSTLYLAAAVVDRVKLSYHHD
jgi:hypothetical protein